MEFSGLPLPLSLPLSLLLPLRMSVALRMSGSMGRCGRRMLFSPSLLLTKQNQMW
jgi:hypothetical protein